MSSSTPAPAPAEAPPWTLPSGSTASTYASSSSRSSSSSSQPSSQATATASAGPAPCAACKHQRRRCTADCVLAPYFPANQPDKFRDARRLFGVKSMLRLLRAAGPANRDVCMRTILYESVVRRQDPVHGCRGVIRDLENQLRDSFVVLATLQQQLALHRGTAAIELHPPPASNNPHGASSTATASSLDGAAWQQQQQLATNRQAPPPEMQWLSASPRGGAVTPTELTVMTQTQAGASARPQTTAMPRQTASNMSQLASTSRQPMMNDGDVVTWDHDA